MTIESNDLISGITKATEVLANRVLTQHKMSQTTIVMLRNMDAKISALYDVLIAKGIATELEIESHVDRNIGLRLRSQMETISNGDMVWISYEGQVDGEDSFSETNITIRVGSGSSVLESVLVGLRPHTLGVTHSEIFKEGERAGKTVNFKIDIGRVKTVIEVENEQKSDSEIN